MRRLLSANLAYVARCKWFWTGGLVMLAWAAIDCFSVRQSVEMGYGTGLDNTLLRGAMILLMVLPPVCGLVLNVEYHDGVIRNKLLAGRSRAAVYISNLTTTYLMGLCYLLAYELACLALGAGIGVENPQSVAGRLALLLLTFLALSALAALIAMLVTGRAALVLCTLVGLGLLFGANALNGMLANPPSSPDWEQIQDVYSVIGEDGVEKNTYIGLDGKEIPEDQVPMLERPNYIREPLRTVLRKVNDALPGGQIQELVYQGHGAFDEDRNYYMEETPHWQLAAWALLVTALLTGLGLALFSKKDLK